VQLVSEIANVCKVSK